MPTLQELSDLFDIRPIEPLPQPRQKRPANNAQPESKPKPTIISVQVAQPSILQRCLPWVFPPQKAATPERRVNPFVALKNGKKMVVIAVVDAGNIGFFKFSEGEFSEWPMA